LFFLKILFKILLTESKLSSYITSFTFYCTKSALFKYKLGSFSIAFPKFSSSKISYKTFLNIFIYETNLRLNCSFLIFYFKKLRVFIIDNTLSSIIFFKRALPFNYFCFKIIPLLVTFVNQLFTCLPIFSVLSPYSPNKKLKYANKS